MRRSHLPRLREGGSLAQLIARQAEAFERDEGYATQYGQVYPGVPGDIINFQHDPLACAIALGWDEGVEIEEIPIATYIRNGWLHQIIDADGKPTQIVTQVDSECFNEAWLDAVTRT